MAKAKAARKSVKSVASRGSRPQRSAMPRSMQSRGATDTRKAVQDPRSGRQARARRAASESLTRVTHETEVRGTETRVERVVERAPKPIMPDVDRASAGRGRYVYCIIRSTQPLRFGAIGMDETWPDVYTINYKDMAAVVSDVPIAPLDSTRENVLAHERVNETVMREVIGDRSVNGGNVLTSALLDRLRAEAGGWCGPMMVYGEASRLGVGRLNDEGVTFKQTPYDVRAR